MHIDYIEYSHEGLWRSQPKYKPTLSQSSEESEVYSPVRKSGSLPCTYAATPGGHQRSDLGKLNSDPQVQHSSAGSKGQATAERSEAGQTLRCSGRKKDAVGLSAVRGPEAVSVNRKAHLSVYF